MSVADSIDSSNTHSFMDSTFASESIGLNNQEANLKISIASREKSNSPLFIKGFPWTWAIMDVCLTPFSFPYVGFMWYWVSTRSIL